MDSIWFLKEQSFECEATYWLNNKDDIIPQDIIDTINGDISDNDFTWRR